MLGVVALSDFYHWEYEYGHDLDTVHAIIKVPGMTYQPPLIGSKQLLNFTAIVADDRRHSDRRRVRHRLRVESPARPRGTAWRGRPRDARRETGPARAEARGARRDVSLVVACAPRTPESIALNSDACTYCRMLISDGRFAAAIVTAHGRTVKFDSIECLLAYYQQASAAHDVALVWVSDYRHPGTLLDGARSLHRRRRGSSPGVGRGLAAVASARDAAALGVIDAGAIKRWGDLQ